MLLFTSTGVLRASTRAAKGRPKAQVTILLSTHTKAAAREKNGERKGQKLGNCPSCRMQPHLLSKLSAPGLQLLLLLLQLTAFLVHASLFGLKLFGLPS
eukprot:1148571-Pelagomonas_calceolata.AAC.10